MCVARYAAEGRGSPDGAAPQRIGRLTLAELQILGGGLPAAYMYCLLPKRETGVHDEIMRCALRALNEAALCATAWIALCLRRATHIHGDIFVSNAYMLMV